MALRFLMQARSSSDGQLYTWVASAQDFVGAGFPGPGAAEDVAIVKRVERGIAGVDVPQINLRVLTLDDTPQFIDAIPTRDGYSYDIGVRLLAYGPTKTTKRWQRFSAIWERHPGDAPTLLDTAVMMDSGSSDVLSIPGVTLEVSGPADDLFVFFTGHSALPVHAHVQVGYTENEIALA